VPCGHLLGASKNVDNQSNGHALDGRSAEASAKMANGHANGTANGNGHAHAHANGNGHDLKEAKANKMRVEKADGSQVETQDWEAIIARARKEVITKLNERFGADMDFAPGEDFESLIETELVNTPQTWRDNLNLYKGSILGLSHNILQVLCLRPRLVHDTIKDLYFVGASTHPGTGVPVVVCGAKITSEQILNDLKVPIPWKLSGTPAESKVNKNDRLNQIRRPKTYWYEMLASTVMLPLILTVLLVRIIFRYDMAKYFRSYEA